MKITIVKNNGVQHKVMIVGHWVDYKIIQSEVFGKLNGLKIWLDPKVSENPNIYFAWIYGDYTCKFVLKYGSPEKETIVEQLHKFFLMANKFGPEVLKEADLVLSTAKEIGFFNWFNVNEGEGAKKIKKLIDDFKFVSLL